MRKRPGLGEEGKEGLGSHRAGLSAAEKEHIIECTTPKAAWDILEKLYEGKVS